MAVAVAVEAGERRAAPLGTVLISAIRRGDGGTSSCGAAPPFATRPPLGSAPPDLRRRSSVEAGIVPRWRPPSTPRSPCGTEASARLQLRAPLARWPRSILGGLAR